MSAHTTQVDDLRLVAQPSAVSLAELFVRMNLSDWSLKPILAQASAVTARFVRAVVDASNPAAPAFITVRLRLRDDILAIEVDDTLSALAAPQAGPGERVGVEPLPGGGRTTWCELALPGGMSARQVALPKRQGRRTLVDEPVTGEPVAADPAVLERLLSHLSGLPSD